MVAGQDSETARINRQTVVDAVFRAKISYRVFLGDPAKGFDRLGQIGFHFGGKAVNTIDKSRLGGLLPKPELADFTQNLTWILLAFLPQARIEVTKNTHAADRPKPKEILRNG